MEEFVEYVIRRIQRLEAAKERLYINAENEHDQIKRRYFERLTVKAEHKIEALYELLEDITY